ncbi:hypothetical protein HID58_035127 [Brassica napus]|uniref:(rape) hypothetical protein n=1 Tax=Brassica napus TaxID=3708 RepID=A0A816PBZ8_BRANA|nr:hypothetical protein HID58_035127 [Brassica napus]CAF2046647.1 unnamed protein product [Brassica napus]
MAGGNLRDEHERDGGIEVDNASDLQMYRIHSIESTVVIPPITRTLSSFTSIGSDSPRLNIVELGSGTGFVGIAAAATLGANVTLTDLPNVIENLKFNANANAQAVARFGGEVHVAPLRWGEAGDVEDLGGDVGVPRASL